MCTLFVTACISIKRTETRKVDDGSSSISKEDSLSLHDFSEADAYFLKRPDLFEFITADQLRLIAQKNKYTIVVFWASWCPVCHDYLSNLKLWKDSITDLKQDIGVTLISQNINIKYLKTIVQRYNYPCQSYIIDPRIYGTDERNKQDKFLNEFNPTRSQTYGSVPRTIILNNNGDMIFEVPGKNVSLKQLMNKMKQ